MCIPCHASWLTHQATQGTRASCINQPMVNVTVTIIKLEHERLQIAPVRKRKKTLVMRSMLCKININNIFKWGKVHPSVGLLWCHKGAGGVVATARWPPLDFIYFPFKHTMTIQFLAVSPIIWLSSPETLCAVLICHYQSFLLHLQIAGTLRNHPVIALTCF